MSNWSLGKYGNDWSDNGGDVRAAANDLQVVKKT